MKEEGRRQGHPPTQSPFHPGVVGPYFSLCSGGASSVTVSLMGLQPNKEPQLKRDTALAFENLVLKRVTQLHLRRNTVLPRRTFTPPPHSCPWCYL